MSGNDLWLSSRLQTAADDMPDNPARLVEVIQRRDLRRRRGYRLAATAAVIAVACGVVGVTRWHRHGIRVATSVTVPSQRTPSTPATAPPTLGTSTNEFVSQLRSRGLVAQTNGVVEPMYLDAAQGRAVTVGGGRMAHPTDIQVYEYTSAAAALADARRFQPDGSFDRVLPNGNVQRVIPEWIAPPHIYQAGRLLVTYAGTDAALLAILTDVVGPPLIGQ